MTICNVPTQKQLHRTIRRQEDIQCSKNTFRGLSGYSQKLYPAGFELPGDLNPPLDKTGRYFVPYILQAIGNKAGRLRTCGSGEPVLWLDVGGGMGRAQSQIKPYQDSFKLPIRTINQDLIANHASTDLKPGLKEMIDMGQDFTPESYIADICVQTPAEKADYTTSVFSIPYWGDPLRGLANMYNNLRPGGLMSVCTDTAVSWSGLIRYTAQSKRQQGPVDDLLEALTDNGIPHTYATTATSLTPNPRSLREVFTLSVYKPDDRTMHIGAAVAATVQIPDGTPAISGHNVTIYDLNQARRIAVFA